MMHNDESIQQLSDGLTSGQLAGLVEERLKKGRGR